MACMHPLRLTPTALFRVDPATGDVTTSTGPNQVYSYSDFTGGVRRTVIATGTYDETFDALCDSPTWETLGFGVDTPAGTTVTFVGRTADTIAGLATADAVTIAEAPTDGTPADVLTAFMGAGVTPGRYFRLTTILAGEPGSTPPRAPTGALALAGIPLLFMLHDPQTENFSFDCCGRRCQC